MKEFKFLKIARVVFIILAWVALGFGLIGAIGIFVAGGGAATTTPEGVTIPPMPKAFGIFPLIQGGVGFFIFFTIAQIISAVLEIRDYCSKPSA